LLQKRWPERWNDLSRKLGLQATELQQWLTVAQALATGHHPKTGLFEQFSGYFDLEYINLADYAGRSVPMDVVLGRERTQQTQVVKQSDVVALLALLPEEFGAGEAAENFRFYEPRCSHGSSLSPAMHGLIAARLADAEMALRFFRRTADIDLGSTHVATGGGVHIAAQGGIWMLAVFGFGGLLLRDDGIAIDPNLPMAWQGLSFSVHWRQRRLKISINRVAIEATLESGDPMVLSIRGEPHKLGRDHTLRVAGVGSPKPPG
jgi:trehalose/maltose hydrolase-like predicted phosphorylase